MAHTQLGNTRFAKFSLQGKNRKLRIQRRYVSGTPVYRVFDEGDLPIGEIWQMSYFSAQVSVGPNFREGRDRSKDKNFDDNHFNAMPKAFAYLCSYL